MAMHRTRSSSSQCSSSSSSSPLTSSSSSSSKTSSKVLSIECIRGTSRAEEWSGDLLQTGDVVEEIQIADLILRSPFKDGNSGVQKQLHSCFKSKLTSIRVRVRRGGDEFAELNACVVPDGRKKKQYVLRAVDDPNYAVAFFDRKEAECLELQASRASRLHHALSSTQLQHGYVAYPWERKMQEMLHVPNSSCFFSVLFLPKASEKGSGTYNDVEDTVARATAWLNASQASGVPVIFTNIQTESLLTKISGETASSTVNTTSLSDLPNLANTSLYGFEDYHGVDIGVVRSVRLWYSSIQGEYPVDIGIEEGDVKFGFAISRTEEGFIFISSVLEGNDDVPSARSGLNELYRDAMRDSKLLVISRVNNHKILPWIVSSSGAVRCFDTVSLSQKISLHRHAQAPLLIHLLMWDGRSSSSSSSRKHTTPVPLAMPLQPAVQFASHSSGDQNQLLSLSRLPSEARLERDDIEVGLTRDTAGEESFRFHNFSLPANWV